MEKITRQEMEKLSHNFQVRFALFCAYQVKDKWDKYPKYVKDKWDNTPEAVKAIRVAELWLEGKASCKECRTAADVAYTAAAYASNAAAWAAGSAAYAAANAANAAAYAANAAAWTAATAYASNAAAAPNKAKIIEEQWDYYNELLNFDEIVEKALLGEDI